MRAPDGEYLATVKALDRAGNETQKGGIITVETNLLTLFLPPAPPEDKPLPPEPADASGNDASSFGGEESTEKGFIPTTGLFTSGGISTVTGTATRVSFSSPTPATAEPAAGSEGILWGATAAAAIAAFAAEVERQRREAEAARARAAQEWGRGKASNPLTYKQIARAYQASLNNFKAALNAATTSGTSAAQAQALKQQVAQTGKSEGALVVCLISNST